MTSASLNIWTPETRIVRSRPGLEAREGGDWGGGVDRKARDPGLVVSASNASTFMIGEPGVRG